ncbi:3176_t:CDS:2 [Ambispora leptoticha]|uniref:3176_t:CDS:1 n=1 Tax=Ambispora leptoticha TaxID=144679 RepID=A0A9N9EBT2_9GLOM|nr:3176_t:CDS:2 [Ambispora leptoticha]
MQYHNPLHHHQSHVGGWHFNTGEGEAHYHNAHVPPVSPTNPQQHSYYPPSNVQYPNYQHPIATSQYPNSQYPQYNVQPHHQQPQQSHPPVQTPPIQTPPIDTPSIHTPPIQTPPIQTPPTNNNFSSNPEINSQEDLEASPMHNPSKWKKIWWGGFAVINFYTLIGTLLLVYMLYKEADKKSISRDVFIIIAIFELLPRFLNIYQIKKFTCANLGFWDGVGIFIGKKEAYLLFGNEYLTEKQVGQLSFVADLICFFYLGWLVYAWHTDLGHLKEDSTLQDDMIKKAGTNLILLAVAALFLVLRAIGELLRFIFMRGKYNHTTRREKETITESSRGLSESDDNKSKEERKKLVEEV